MKKSVLPQPRRRPPPLVSPAIFSLTFCPGQTVEVSRGELAGARGTVVKSGGPSRWLVKLDGMPPGALLSMPRDGLRHVQARSK
jgi:hypothetical protein